MYTHITQDESPTRRTLHYKLVGGLLVGKTPSYETWPPLYLECQVDLPWYPLLVGLAHNASLTHSLDYEVLCNVCLEYAMVPCSIPPARKWDDKSLKSWEKEIREKCSIEKNHELYYAIAALAGREVEEVPSILPTMPPHLAERMLDKVVKRGDLAYIRTGVGEPWLVAWMGHSLSSIVDSLARAGLLRHYVTCILAEEVSDRGLIFCEMALNRLDE